MDVSYNQAQLVHGDLSRYNILYSYGHPYIIDVSQATLTSHPASMQLLDRDIENIVYDSKKFNLDLTFDYIKERIIKKD